MKTIITFKAQRRGRVVYKHIPICHNFKELPSTEFNGIILPPASVDSQVMEQLDNIDKSDLMLQYDFDAILDYYPKRKRAKRNEMDEFIDFCEPYLSAHPKFVIPFRKVISESKDVLFGKSKSNEQKFKETLNLVNVSLKAAMGAINLINSILHQKNVSIT
ncbi:MAG: hypothetical protein ACI30I_04265 [Parabacteroides sp.]